MGVGAALHVARRLSFGPTPELVAQITKLGISAWIDSQLTPESIVDTETDLATDPYPYPGLDPAVLSPGIVDSVTVVDQQRSVVAIRQLMSQRQLFEVMAAFWADHFSIYGNHQVADRWRAWDDRQVARKYALATFPELLNASAHSPAMLTYLDNANSSGKDPNLNYARELLELHTVGVDAGYTEDDVRNAALALTGWGVEMGLAKFKFTPAQHYVGPVRVMGWRHANKAGDGETVGQSLLDYLAHHPATSRHLATKLCRRLVSDSPPGALGNRVAATLQDSGLSIPAAIRTITGSREFLAAADAKYRRPGEWLISSLRAVGAKAAVDAFPYDRHPIVDLMQGLGHLPFGWIPPNGYPDVAVKWESTAQTMKRWNLAQSIAYGGVGGVSGYDPAQLLGSPAPRTAGELVDRLCVRILGAKGDANERAGLLEIVGRLDGASITQANIDAALRPLVALILSTPTMQVH